MASYATKEHNSPEMPPPSDPRIADQTLATLKAKIAIVIPLFNVAQHIKNCLQSLLAQTYKNFEVFAVDDGSTDNSLRILQEYSNKLVIRILHQDNQGQAVARNTALDSIFKSDEFQYVAFVDADDKVSPYFLEKLVLSAEKNRADVTVCGFVRQYKNCVCRSDGPFPKVDNFDRDQFINLIFSQSNGRKTSASGGMLWNKLFRAVLISNIRFLCERNICEDELFCLKAASRGTTFALVCENLYIYNQLPTSTSHRSDFDYFLMRGRSLCFPVAEGISRYAVDVVNGAYAYIALSILKTNAKSSDHDEMDLKSLEPYVDRALSSGLLSKRSYRRFVLFRKHPVYARLYVFGRRLFMASAFWKAK